MSRTFRKIKKKDAWLNNNGPSDFKQQEKARRRAQDKDALRNGREPNKKWYYSEWYW